MGGSVLAKGTTTVRAMTPRAISSSILEKRTVKIVRDHDLGFAVLCLKGQLFQSIERIEIDDRAASFQYCKVIDDEGRRIRQEEADLGSSPDPGFLKPGSDPVHLMRLGRRRS